MSTCGCEKNFPPRTFKSASDADEYMSVIRMAPAWRYVGTEGGETQRERYRCRACGADWACTVPPAPPFTWGPLFARPAEIPEAPAAVPPAPRPAPKKEAPPQADPIPLPAAPLPFALPVDDKSAPADAPPPDTNAPFLEVGPHRVPSDVFTLVYEDEAAPAVNEVLAALADWRPGLWSWKANAGFADIEIEIAPPMPKGESVYELFAKTWKPELVNPSWRKLGGGKGLRPVHLRGIRKRGAGAGGFLGEYYLIVVDTKTKKVAAWMMTEAK